MKLERKEKLAKELKRREKQNKRTRGQPAAEMCFRFSVLLRSVHFEVLENGDIFYDLLRMSADICASKGGALLVVYEERLS